MKEKDLIPKINQFLKDDGFWPITQTDATRTRCPKCGTWVMSYPPKGRPDIIGLHPADPGIVVEAKLMRDRLPFSAIDDKQRRWLDAWMNAQGQGFLGIGAVEKVKHIDRLLDLWLVPWRHWLDIEERVSPYQDSLPYQAHRIVMRREGLDTQLLADHKII